MKGWSANVLAVLCLLFLEAAIGRTPAAAALDGLTVSYSSITGASASTWAPEEAGILEKTQELGYKCFRTRRISNTPTLPRC